MYLAFLTRRLRTAALVAAVSLLVLLSAAHPAAAAPLDPTLALPQLQAMLQASLTGAVDGYFKTAVKGATIATVPCTVLGVVPQAAVDNGDLIMFRAAGPVIEEAGGIAAGMSGSPLYVNDGGEDLLVGAVSYGEYFTSNGLGLATPIEHMMELESALDADPLAARLARTVTLAEPLETGEATIDSVVVAPTSRAARGARRGDGTVVVRSLSALMVSGLPTDTAAYRALKNDFADRGIELRGGFAAGAVGEEPGFETPLVPGSSVGMLHMRGDYWYGGIGTTTYTTAVDGGALVGFGHPMEYDGRLSAFMTNADVIGLWNNADEPHKVLAPGAVRGEITVDSGAGIAGLIGDGPASVPFVCTATNAATPLFEDRADLFKGKTIVGIGSYRPDMREYPDAIFKAVSAVFIDTEHAFDETGDLLEPLRSGVVRREGIRTLGSLLTDRMAASSTGSGAFFKSVGFSAFDLYVAKYLFHRGVQSGKGTDLAL